MKKSEKIISFILTTTAIILAGIIGILGYAIYSEITGKGQIHINLSAEAGYPVIEYKTSDTNTISPSLNETIFSGISEGEEPEQPTQYSEYRNLYNQLDKNAKIIYDKLYQNKENLKTGTYRVQFGETFSELLLQENGDEELQRQYQSAIEAFLYDNPDVFYLDATNMYINIEKITKITGVKFNVYINQGKKTSYLAEGFYTKEDVARSQNETEQAKNKILGLIADKTDYEKIRIVHDYLIATVEYESTLLESNIYNIYGALVSKKCVCEGYAKAFQYLMNEVGIDNVIVIGTGTNSKDETENHAWNYVKLEGKWYAIDVTWDDPIIIGGGKLSKESKYKYFLRGSKSMNENHIASGQFTAEGQIFTYPTLSIEDY